MLHHCLRAKGGVKEMTSVEFTKQTHSPTKPIPFCSMPKSKTGTSSRKNQLAGQGKTVTGPRNANYETDRN